MDASGEILEELNVLINPGCVLPAVITKITGITDEDLDGLPGFDHFMPQIRAMFEKADVLIAHNLPFDATLMELELARLKVEDWPWPKINLCTVQEHTEEWGRRPKLTELYKHYMGEPLAQTHRAIDDVKALAAICIKAGVLR